MTTVLNDFEEGAAAGGSGITITAANSAGPGELAFTSTGGTSPTAPRFSTAQAAHGSYSGLITCPSSDTSLIRLDSGFTSPATTWFRQYVYIPTAPTGLPMYVGAIYSTASAAYCMYFGVTTSGYLFMTALPGSTTTTGSTTVATGQWIRLEGYCTGGPSTGAIELKLFNTMDAATPDATITATSQDVTNYPVRLYIGNVIAGSSPTSWYYDDVAMSNTGYIGPAVVPAVGLVQAATPTLNTQSITFARNITPGNSVVVCMSRNNAWTAPITISGNGNTLTLAKVSANNFCAVYYYSNVGASPGATITAASGAAVLYAYEVAGPITLDQAVASSTFGGSAGTTWTASTATLAQATEFAAGVVYGISGPSSIAGTASGWTEEATEANAAVSGYEVTAATSALTYSGTFGSASTYEACLCTFSPASTSFSGSPTTGITLAPSATGASARSSSRTTGVALTPTASGSVVPYSGSPSTGVVLGHSAAGASQRLSSGTAGVTLTASCTGSMGSSSFTGAATTGITLTAGVLGSLTDEAGSALDLESGLTLDLEAGAGGGVVPFAGSPSTGITLTLLAAGTSVRAASRTAGITLAPTATGGAVTSGSVTAGITLAPSATGTAVTPKNLFMSLASQAGTDEYGNPYLQGMDLIALPGLTNVLSVSDTSGDKMAGIDSSGNISSAGSVSAASDVLIGGVSLAGWMASVNASLSIIAQYIVDNPGSGSGGSTAHTELFYPAATWSYWYTAGLRGENVSMTHGYYGDPANWEYSYIQWAVGSLGNNLNTVLNYTVTDVSLRLYNQHSWYSSGMYFGLHSSVSLGAGPGGYSSILNPGGSFIAEGAMVTYDLSSSMWAPLKSAGVTYTVLAPDTADQTNYGWYGYFYGGGGSPSYMPLLTVSYDH